MPETFDLAVLGTEPDSEILQLLQRCPDVEPLRFLDGEFLVQEGEANEDLFIVVKGAFTVERPPVMPGARPAILASTLCDPENLAIVGEMAYFGTRRRTASVRASGATYVLCLKPRHIDEIINGFPMLTRVICQQFTQRLKESNEALLKFQERFALAAEKRMAASGEVLFRKGYPAKELHQLLVGRVRIEGEGGTRIVGPEELFQGFLDPEPFLRNGTRSATATVEADAFLAVIPASQKETLLRCHPQLALNVLEG